MYKGERDDVDRGRRISELGCPQEVDAERTTTSFLEARKAIAEWKKQKQKERVGGGWPKKKERRPISADAKWGRERPSCQVRYLRMG